MKPRECPIDIVHGTIVQAYVHVCGGLNCGQDMERKGPETRGVGRKEIRDGILGRRLAAQRSSPRLSW